MTAAAPTTKTTPAKPPAQDTNVKETIESIIVAFILAFVFRCFVIEAFVIPTGSMAPTLLGAHMQMRCPDCGYRFTVGSGPSDQVDATYSIPAKSESIFTIFCPNCAYRLPRDLPDDHDNDAKEPPLRYGDRILVMKYLYLLHNPQRWDVVVFKTPDPGNASGDYSTNYIKRLTGLPGESIMIAEGDLYVAPPGADVSKPESYRIQTKPRPAQDALWRVVYDGDYVPTGKSRQYTNPNGVPVKEDHDKWKFPWAQTYGNGWNLDQKRRFTFDDSNGRGEISFLTDANPNISPLTDFLAYGQSYRTDVPHGARDMFGLPGYGLARGGPFVTPVSDLKLNCVVGSMEGPGTLQFMLGKGPDRFTAEFSASKVRLTRKTARGEAMVLGEAPLSVRWPMQVQFSNVDHRVSLSVNGSELLATTPEQYAPDVAAVVGRIRDGEAPPNGYVQILGDRIKTELSHVQLWRDVCYLDRGENRPVNERDARRATARDFPNNVATLGQKEFFVLGDNSYQSEDARYWDNGVQIDSELLDVPAGRVPERFMLGKAFFVYWPAGYKPFEGAERLPLIPNFGEMRLIR